MENNEKNTEQNNSDDPGERFRRLISSIENADPGAVTPPIRRKTKPEEEKPVEESPEVDSVESRHPTGEPDQTAGWYASDIEDLKKDMPDKKQQDLAANLPGIDQSGQVWQSRYDLGSRPLPVESETNQENKSDPKIEKTQPAVPFDEMETIPPPPGATQPFLPNRVNEFDTQATRVSPVAYGGYPPPHQYSEMTQPSSVETKKKKKKEKSYRIQ